MDLKEMKEYLYNSEKRVLDNSYTEEELSANPELLTMWRYELLAWLLFIKLKKKR